MSTSANCKIELPWDGPNSDIIHVDKKYEI